MAGLLRVVPGQAGICIKSLYYEFFLLISKLFACMRTSNISVKQFNLNTKITFFTAPFNNMRTLTFKAQPTNAFFATVNQVFGDSSQLPTTVERSVIKSLSTVQITKECSAVVGS